MQPSIRLLLLTTSLLAGGPSHAGPPPPKGSKAPKVWKHKLGMAFVPIPGGTFRMGSPEGVGHSSEHPAHLVTLGPFAMGQTPVTVGEFRVFVAATGYRTEAERSGGATVALGNGKVGLRADATWLAPGFPPSDRDPVVCVTWPDAQAFVAWLNAKESTTVYHLPTEAQWEYACRAGNPGLYGFGDDGAQLVLHAWFDADSAGRSHPVATKAPNGWGLYDMHGNVWQWCADWYGEKAYPEAAARDPQGPAKGQLRTLRGGSWYSHADRCRAAFRGGNLPSSRFSFVGFRVVAEGPPRRP